jgi:hypothetical protein
MVWKWILEASKELGDQDKRLLWRKEEIARAFGKDALSEYNDRSCANFEWLCDSNCYSKKKVIAVEL